MARIKMGAGSFWNCASLHCNIMRNDVPAMPARIPSSRNHGNCSRLVKLNGGTSYKGVMPKKLRDTIAATTDEKTSGANRFMEKLPSTIKDANTAPEMGALYAAEMPEAAPQATSRRNRYGCQCEICPHFDAKVAARFTMAPSLPSDPPLPMLSREETALTNPVRKGSRPSLATTTSRMLVEPCLPTSRNPQYSTKPATSPPTVGVTTRCQ